MMVLMTLTPGISIITSAFLSPASCTSANWRGWRGHRHRRASAIVKGGRPLSGAQVMASDLRASRR